MKQDTLLEATYIYRNISKNPLIVQAIEPDCGCTSFKGLNDTIVSNEYGEIKLFIDTKNKLGLQKLSAIVSFNTNVKYYKIRLRAKVILHKRFSSKDLILNKR